VLIDSHCHLDSGAFERDREEVVARAQAAGVERILVIACGPGEPSTDRALRCAARWPELVRLTAGVHPHQAAEAGESDYRRLARLAGEGALVGLGETGLDYHYDRSPRPVQRAVFRRHLRLARHLDLPVVIHSRQAEDDTLAILHEEGLPERGGVVHCFSSDRRLATGALELGLHLGLTGMITRAWAQPLRELIAELPADRLLAETDAPYLAPRGFGSRRNEPAAVELVVQALARIRETTYRAQVATLAENYHRLFEPCGATGAAAPAP